MTTLPVLAPTPNPETAEFWAATGHGRLLLKRCAACGVVIWYPRAVCPGCHATATEWFDASGRGHVYSFTVSRRGEGAYRDAAPYVLAYVELEEGPRVLTNIVDCDIDAVAIGQPVQAVFVDTGQDNAIVRFRPV